MSALIGKGDAVHNNVLRSWVKYHHLQINVDYQERNRYQLEYFDMCAFHFMFCVSRF